MSDGAIGYEKVTIPDLIDPVVAFRTMTFIPPTRIAKTQILGNPATWREPNAFKMDPKTGAIIPDQDARRKAYERFLAEIKLRNVNVLVNWEPHLKSPNRNFIWDHENEAACERTDKLSYIGTHTPPGHNCQCGLYCYYEPPTFHGPTNNVLAIVTVSGVIEAHESGMRSQYMRIEHLFGFVDEVNVLAEKWKIPYTQRGVEHLLDHADLRSQVINTALEYGSPMPMNMRAGQDERPPF